MKLSNEQGEAELKITPLTRQIRFTNLGPGDLEVALVKTEDRLTVNIKNDSSRILRAENIIACFVRTSTTCEFEIKEFK